MTGRREGDLTGLVGDAVMGPIEDLVARLRHGREPAEAAHEPDAPAGDEPFPVGPLAEAVAVVVAAVLPRVLARMDPDVLLDRVDVQRLVDRVDVPALARRVDLGELADRIDVNAIVERIDIDALVRRIDLEAAAREALAAVDVGEIVRESTATIGSDVVEGLRSQAMRADDLLARLIDRVLGRDGDRRTSLDGRGGTA